ncbi:MAG: hypothetical protein ACE5LG_07065, partial [Anaerolineae bacterium]
RQIGGPFSTVSSVNAPRDRYQVLEKILTKGLKAAFPLHGPRGVLAVRSYLLTAQKLLKINDKIV